MVDRRFFTITALKRLNRVALVTAASPCLSSVAPDFPSLCIAPSRTFPYPYTPFPMACLHLRISSKLSSIFIDRLFIFHRIGQSPLGSYVFLLSSLFSFSFVLFPFAFHILDPYRSSILLNEDERLDDLQKSSPKCKDVQCKHNQEPK